MKLPTEEQLRGMPEEELRKLLKKVRALGPMATFSWHEQQEQALRAATNVVMVLGGNQSGKTTVGRGIVSRLVRREGPIYRRLRNPDGRALKLWVSPQTFEKYKSNWELQLRNEVFRGIETEYVQSPIPRFTWHDRHGGGELWGKSQDQGFMAFESDVVDAIVFDEEPEDRRLYTSSIARLSTTNGIIVLTFTPLLGLSWTYTEFYVPAVRQEFQVGDRHWRRGNAITVIQMGMADNPAAVAGGGVARIRDNPSMSEAEKATRLYGKYGYTEGLIWKQFAGLSVEESSPYLVDALPKDRTYEWVLACDPNKRHGGLLSALDHQGILWVVDQHYLEGVPDRIHAAAYFALFQRNGLDHNKVDIWADPGGAGAQAIINLADLGINAAPVSKGEGSVKASIELIRRALFVDPSLVHPITGKKGSPRLFILRGPASRWTIDGVEYHENRLLWEVRQYRQKTDAPPDTPIKEKDDLVDCLRYTYLARGTAPPPPEDRSDLAIRAGLDSLSRKAHDEFENLAQQTLKRRAGHYTDEYLGRM